jgi:6-pyruvoyltetrahydropterin/6-carboxytetrahydropterin synthase
MFIELDGWMAKLRFSACHFIPNHPKCGRLHGHTYAVSVQVEGEQVGEFIIDFERLKNMVSEICDRLDHYILIASMDKRLRLVERKETISVEVLDSGKKYVFPREDVILLPIESLSAEDLCKYFTGEIARGLKEEKNIREIQVRVDEGIGQGAACTIFLNKGRANF